MESLYLCEISAYITQSWWVSETNHHQNDGYRIKRGWVMGNWRDVTSIICIDCDHLGDCNKPTTSKCDDFCDDDKLTPLEEYNEYKRLVNENRKNKQ